MTGKRFYYDNIKISGDRKTINFYFHIDTDQTSIIFNETFTVPLPVPESKTVDRLLRSLHLALGISYYKVYFPPEIEHPYQMDEEEASFWNTIFRNGLGEFLYINKLSADNIATFHAQSGTITYEDTDDVSWYRHALLGIGGGKDSIVAGELLKKIKLPTTGFVLATGTNQGQAYAVAKTMEYNLFTVERRIDAQLLELNKQDDTYNGHIPISVIFALTGCLLATIDGAQHVIVANESSASIPHVTYEGSEVNHQWSKSLEFEKLFQAYLKKNISKELFYSSVIRPISSVAVAKIFSKYPQYFEVFTSDNAVFKIDAVPSADKRWNKNSTKSLSSFMLLAPWLEDNELYRIFGHNYLQDNDLTYNFLNLLGYGDKTILDCVGTPDELRLCISLLARDNRFMDTALMKLAQKNHILLSDTNESLQFALRISGNFALPFDIKQDILDALKEKLA